MAQEKVHQPPIIPLMASSLEDLNLNTSTTQLPPATPASQPDNTHLLSQISTLLTKHQRAIQENISHQHKLILYHLHNHLDTRYTELTRLVKETHHHITKATGITPPTPWFPSADDEAKKGEKAALMGQAKKAQAALDDKFNKKKKKALNRLAKVAAANRERMEQQHAAGGPSSRESPMALPSMPSFPEIIAQAVAAGHIPADFITTADISADVQTTVAQTTAEPSVGTKTATSVVITTTDAPTTDKVSSAVVQSSTPAVASSVVATSPINKLVKKKRKLVITEEDEEHTSPPLSQQPTSPPVQLPSNKNKSLLEELEDLTEEEIAEKEKELIKDSVMQYLQEQGYTGKMLETRFKEEADKLIKEFNDAAKDKPTSTQKPKPKSKSKSTIPADERQKMIEELILNDFGARNSVSKWQDKRLREEYLGLLEWKKKNPQDFKAFDSQALIIKPTKSKTAKSKHTPTPPQSKTYTIMIPATPQPSSLPQTGEQNIEQYLTREYHVHSELVEEEKFLLTEQFNPEEVGIMESVTTKGDTRTKRKILQLPSSTYNKPKTKSSVIITEMDSSPDSTAPIKPTPPPKSQSKSLSKIVKWTVDKKTSWMLLTREDGLVSIYKNWHDLLGLSDYDHQILIHMNIEGEEGMTRAKEFEIELKGQLWQKYFSKK